MVIAQSDLTPDSKAPSCPVCGDPVCQGAVIACSKCGVPHHGDCWNYNQRCGIFACGNNTPSQTSLSLESSLTIPDQVLPATQSKSLPQTLPESHPSNPIISAAKAAVVGMGISISDVFSDMVIEPVQTKVQTVQSFARSFVGDSPLSISGTYDNPLITVRGLPVMGAKGEELRDYAIEYWLAGFSVQRDEPLNQGMPSYRAMAANEFGALCRALYRSRHSLKQMGEGWGFLKRALQSAAIRKEESDTPTCLVCDTKLVLGPSGIKAVVHSPDTSDEVQYDVEGPIGPYSNLFKALFGYDRRSPEGEELDRALCWLSQAPGFYVNSTLNRTAYPLGSTGQVSFAADNRCTDNGLYAGLFSRTGLTFEKWGKSIPLRRLPRVD